MQNNSFVFETISSLEIIKAIGSLKNSNSSGEDNISNMIVKNIAYLIADVLAFIFNRCVLAGVFPEPLKCADIVPLFKKGSSFDMSNYRPISLLPVFSKIFEKVIKNRMISFLTRTKFFNPVQFGFLSGKSTEDALIQFCDQIMSNLDSKKCTASMFVDITKAFDMVNHNCLLRKLEKAGFRGFMLNWFSSYLENRNQRVKLDEIRSEKGYLHLGVPQGSVLGPILFLVYINSLFLLNLRGKPTAFADDIALSYGSNNRFNLVSDINWDLHLLRVWFAEHKLVISSKTKVLFFSLSTIDNFDVEFFFHANDCQKFKLPVRSSSNLKESFISHNNCCDNCFLVERVSEYKYLGLTIDSNMKFKNHTINLGKYFRSTIRYFYHLQNIVSTDLLRTIYFGIFHSKLQYGIVCWGGSYFNKIEPLLILQKKAIRVICHKSRNHPSFILFQELKILPVRHLYCFKVLKAFYMKSGNRNLRLISNYNLRGNSLNILAIPSFRTMSFRNFYTVSSLRFFNKLPFFLRTITTPAVFIKKLKVWLLDLEYLNIESFVSDTLV